MKKALILMLCLLLTSIGTAGAVTLSLDPTTQTVVPSTLFNIDLLVGGLTTPGVPRTLVGDFDIDILYNPSQMEFKGYKLGTKLGDVSLGEALDWSLGDPTASGAIDLAEVSLLLPQELSGIQTTDPFILATLQFHCLRPGKSVVEIDPSDPLFTYKVGDEFGSPLPVIIAGPAEVNQVPEPSTFLLFGAGLAGVGLLRNRFKKAA